MTDLERNATANQLSADRLSRYRKELDFHRANKTESSHLPLTNSFWKNICNIAGDSWLVLPRYKDLYGTDSVESLVKRPEFSESPLQSLRVHTVSITCHVCFLDFPRIQCLRTSVRGLCTCGASTFQYGPDLLSWWLSCRSRCCSGQQYARNLLR